MAVECPKCGQHDLSTDDVLCPNCGATLTPSNDVERAEAAPPGRTEGREEFAGEETVAGVMEEIREKEEQ
jgi:uncharacterized Zn finger protein (UPF0148 family)